MLAARRGLVDLYVQSGKIALLEQLVRTAIDTGGQGNIIAERVWNELKASRYEPLSDLVNLSQMRLRQVRERVPSILNMVD